MPKENPLCLVDFNLDCPPSCPMYKDALRATINSAKEAGLSVSEYKAQLRSASPLEKAALISKTRAIAKAEGVFDWCVNSDKTSIGIGFDE